MNPIFKYVIHLSCVSSLGTKEDGIIVKIKTVSNGTYKSRTNGTPLPQLSMIQSYCFSNDSLPPRCVCVICATDHSRKYYK